MTGKFFAIALVGFVAAGSTLAGREVAAAERAGALQLAAGDVAHTYEVVDGVSIPKALTDQPGDPAKGREVAINRKKGNCLACHVMPIPEQPFHGLIGPDLNGVASRYEEGELRLRVVDAKAFNPDTIMPAYYKNNGLHRVLKNFEGKTILSAQEVEDIVAYLMTLKE